MDQDQELNEPEDWNQPDESFAELEQELTQALRRVDAPAGFAQRTMARVPAVRSAARKAVDDAREAAGVGRRCDCRGAGGGVFAGQQVHERHERQKARIGGAAV